MRDGHVGYDGVFGIPLSLSCECMYNRRLCPAGGSGDGDDGNIGIPRRCHPSGEHLASKDVCQTFPLDSLMAGLHPAYPALRFG